MTVNKNLFKEVEEKYNGVIKDILNKCSKDLTRAADTFNPDRLPIYQKELIDECCKAIYDVQVKFLADCSSALEKERTRVTANPNVGKTNAELLLEQQRLANKMQIEQMKYRTMNTNDLIKLGDTLEDDISILVCKNELMDRGIRANDSQLQLQARMMTGNPTSKQLEALEVELEAMSQGGSGILPGMELHEQMLITNAGSPRNFLINQLPNKDDFNIN